MELQPVDVIRESTRSLLKLNRQIHRGETSDLHRPLDEETRITRDTIVDIANKLKTKSSITLSELHKLKNGLMEDSKYIEIVLSTHGTLRGLVRELTGHDVKKQCAAAGCCCNLALGDSRACLTVAKTAGPYLIAALDSLATDLAATSARALGTLAGSGPAACGLLTSQGALAQLSEPRSDADVQEAAFYALLHSAYELKDEFRTVYLSKILENLRRHPITMTSSQLLFVLSCHANFLEHATEELVQKILEDLLISIPLHLKSCKQRNCCKIVYLFRTLANMDSKFNNFTINFVVNNHSVVNKLISCRNEVSDAVLWLLGNLYRYNSEHVLFKSLLSIV